MAKMLKMSKMQHPKWSRARCFHTGAARTRQEMGGHWPRRAGRLFPWLLHRCSSAAGLPEWHRDRVEGGVVGRVGAAAGYLQGPCVENGRESGEEMVRIGDRAHRVPQRLSWVLSQRKRSSGSLCRTKRKTNAGRNRRPWGKHHQLLTSAPMTPMAKLPTSRSSSRRCQGRWTRSRYVGDWWCGSYSG